MRKLSVGVAGVLAACMPTSQTSGDTREFVSQETYTHQATGFSFPTAIGPFQRSTIIEYNADKTDVSAGYDKIAAFERIAATVYVYPAPPIVAIGSPRDLVEDQRTHFCNKEWDRIKADIVQAHPDAKLVIQNGIRSPSPGFKPAGRRAIFTFTREMGGWKLPVRSEASLYCYAGAKWFVAYRTTAPATIDYRPDLERLMRDLKWPDSLSG